MARKYLREKIGKINLLLLLGMILFMMFAFVACDNNTNHYTLPDVAVDDTFEIILKPAGTYKWVYDIKQNSGIECISEETLSEHPRDSDWCGSWPVKYTFQATKAGKYKLKFKYVLRWESKEPPLEINIYEIRVVK